MIYNYAAMERESATVDVDMGELLQTVTEQTAASNLTVDNSWKLL